MHKKKKIKTIIVEKFKYDNDDDYGITLQTRALNNEATRGVEVTTTNNINQMQAQQQQQHQ